MKGAKVDLLSVLFTVLALGAVAPQWAQYASHVQKGDYPGTVDRRRVDALLKASTATLSGGPFATIPAGSRYSVAPDIFNDLGTATLVSLYARATGREATHQTLGAINLVYLVLASILLVLAFPARLRLGLVPVFLMVDLVAPSYRSVDTVTIHGSLAALAIALPLLVLTARVPWVCVLWGLLLFGVHKTRSVYATYTILVLLPTLALCAWRFRDRKVLANAAFLVVGFACCEVPWRMAVHERLTDERLIEKDALPEHAVYEALISGIGWTPNPWGIKPWDPWVAQFLADTFRQPVVRISTHEGERRAKAVFLMLAKQRPFALGWLYLKRIPAALQDYSVFGAAGAFAWILAALLALSLAMRRGDVDGLKIVLPPIGLAVCLILQTIVIDTRYIYAHPLILVSALVLATAIPVAIRNARTAPSLIV